MKEKTVKVLSAIKRLFVQDYYDRKSKMESYAKERAKDIISLSDCDGDIYITVDDINLIKVTNSDSDITLLHVNISEAKELIEYMRDKFVKSRLDDKYRRMDY